MATTTLDQRERAFEWLYRRYARDVYRFVLAVVRNPTEVPLDEAVHRLAVPAAERDSVAEVLALGELPVNQREAQPARSGRAAPAVDRAASIGPRRHHIEHGAPPGP